LFLHLFVAFTAIFVPQKFLLTFYIIEELDFGKKSRQF